MSKKDYVQSELSVTNELNTAYGINNLNPLAKYTKLYYILTGLGAVVGIFATPIGSIFFGAMGWLIAWFIIHSTATAKLIKLNFVNYPLSTYVPDKEIKEYLNQNFSNDEIRLDTKSSKITFLYKNATKLTVNIDKDKNCFYITSKATFAKKAKNGGKANSAKLYIDTVQVTPFIVQVIQNAVADIAK